MNGIIEAKREKFSYYSFEKLSREFEGIINQKALELDDLSKDLHMLMESLINAKRSRFDTLIAKLNALSPLETLTRGFAIVEKLPDGKPIFSVNQIFISDNVKTILKDGYFISSIKEIIKGKSKTKTNSGDLTS